MITENQLKRWISYISFIFSMVANFIGLIASWGTASMVGTAIFFTLHVLAFIVFCVWKKMQDIYLRYVLILFMMTLFPYLLWCSPKPSRQPSMSLSSPASMPCQCGKSGILSSPSSTG